MKPARALACIASLLAVTTTAASQSLYEVPRDPAPAAEPVRSVVLDVRSAADARARSAPQYVETIVVEGRRDPDAPRRKPLEVRFAEALAPRPNPLTGLTPFSDAPCMSLASSWNNLGDAHVPLSGCPR
ncbi:MAG: hypothetical protein U1F54_08165 [Burkholderiales bacterium]